MILNDTIIDDIKRKSGLMFDKAVDFGLLSSYIYKDTGRTYWRNNPKAPI